jgi:predicted porin
MPIFSSRITPSFSASALFLFSSCATCAFGQSTVTLYGLVDVGVVRASGGPSGSTTLVSGGVQSGSRLGFKGTEAIADGISAKFQLEMGFLPDSGALGQGGLAFGRQSWVGLATPQGQISAGRQYTPIFNVLDNIDPFSTGLTGDSQNLIVDLPTRMNNSVIYTTPEGLGGFNASVAYGFGEVAGKASGNRQYGFSLGYSRNALNLFAAYHDTNTPDATDHGRQALLGGTYDFGPVTAHVAVGANKGTGSVDSRDGLVGITIPLGKSTVMASYIRKDDRSPLDGNVDQVAIGYTYSLSKRTNLYASYARIHNSAGAAYTIGDASNGYAGTRALALGIRHKF